MNHLQTLLRFQEEDCLHRSVEDLSKHGKISRAFVRLCIAAGCHTQNQALSLAGLLEWLFEHYPAVRALAGLPALVSTEGVTGANLGRLCMGNAMITLLEYTESRCSHDHERAQARQARHCIELALDRQ